MPEVASRFDPKKNHMNLLFHHGRVLQDSEMNELMSLFWHQISVLTNIVFKNGVCTNKPVLTSAHLSCPDAFILIGGKFIFVSKKDLPKNSDARVRYKKMILTAKEDRDLEDQTEGSVNEGQPGADREVIVAEWAEEKDTGSENWYFIKPEYNTDNLSSLSFGNWDAVVSPEFTDSPEHKLFSSLESALLHVKPGSRIFVKNHKSEVKKTIRIDSDDLYIEFSPSVRYLGAKEFPGTGDDSEKSIFYITGSYVTLCGGIHGFPDYKNRSSDYKPKIATATNDTVFFNNVRETGSPDYLLISDNINTNGRIRMENYKK